MHLILWRIAFQTVQKTVEVSEGPQAASSPTQKSGRSRFFDSLPQSADAHRFFTRYVKQAGALPLASAVPWRPKDGGMTLQDLDPGSIL